MLKRYLPLMLLCVAGALGAEPARDRFDKPLPEGAVARLGSLQFRHGSSVQIVGFSLDQKILATFAGGNYLTCWDTASGRVARRVPIGNIMQPRCLRFSTDGKSVIVADWDGAFRISDAVTGVERIKLEPQKLDRRYLDVHAVSVSPDGKTAVTLYSSDILVVWDLAHGKRLGEYPFRNNLNRFANQPIALTPDGKQLVAPHTDGSLHLFDMASGKERLAFEMPSDKPQNYPPRVVISLDGRFLAFGGSSTGASEVPCKSVTVCDMATGKRLRELSLKERIHEWVFTPDSRSLALTDAATIRLFDVSSGKEIKSIRKSKSRGIVFSPDGRKVAASFGTCLSLWDVESGRPLHSPLGHDWFIREIHFFPDCKRLVSNTSGDMIVWDIATSRPSSVYDSGKLQQWISVTGNGQAVQFLDWKLLDWIQRPSPGRRKDKHPNERGLEEGEDKRPSGTEIRTIYRWDMATDRKEQHVNFSIPASCDWFVLSPDGRRIASVTLSSDPRVSLSGVKGSNPAVLAALPDNSRVNEVKFSPDGRRLLLQSWYGAVRVLDSATGQPVLDLKPEAPRRRISMPAFAPDGRSILLNDNQLHIREVASGKDRLQISPANQYPVISPNSRFLASYFRDNSNADGIRVYSTATGKQLAYWRGEQNQATALAVSPDSRFLASGYYDGTLLLWKLPEDDGLPAKISPDEAVAFWQALADEDAARANRALAGLAAAPAQAVPLLNERFPTDWKIADDKQIARWIAELDDDDFKVREQSTRELADAGSDTAAALRGALAKSPSTETKRRIEGILNRLNKGDSPKYLRALRAIEVLERIGTPQAKELLRDLAGKPMPVELKEEVQASLRRLGE